MKTLKLLMLTAALLCVTGTGRADEQTPLPAAIIDLATTAGTAAMNGQWRYGDVQIVETGFRDADANGQPTGSPNRTYDISPRAGGLDFDDAGWPVIRPESLAQRRGAGRLSFGWYRIRLTIPPSVGSFDTRGALVVFDASLDDYAEIWVDGELPRAAGQQGGSVVAGWNADNRLVIGRNVRPGQQIQLAVFGMNGPLSDAPTNYIWLRTARLEFYPGTLQNAGPLAIAPQEVNVRVERLDPAVDRIVPANAKLYKLAEGFQFVEGPVWLPEGALLFSDPNHNTIYRYVEPGDLSVYREQSGYTGPDIAEYRQPGSNGLTLDPQGRLTINEHGNHRVTRLERDGRLTVLAASFEGKRLNSPNDLVFRSDGVLYFTDPPFGLPKFFDDPRRELPYSGIYRLADGRLSLEAKEMLGPNGLAFSPDEKYLYVDNWDTAHKIIMRYPVRADGSLDQGELFFDMTGAPGDEALDGLKTDREGNLYVSGPGGVWIISPDGRHLGTIIAPKLPANFAWGGVDGRTLYLTARSTLYRIDLLVPGIRPQPPGRTVASGAYHPQETR